MGTLLLPVSEYREYELFLLKYSSIILNINAKRMRNLDDAPEQMQMQEQNTSLLLSLGRKHIAPPRQLAAQQWRLLFR